MAIYIGDQKIGKLYIGDVAINEAYIGNELVYKSGGSASWQTIWEGFYKIKATQMQGDNKTYKFADAGSATKFKITFTWDYTRSSYNSYYTIHSPYSSITTEQYTVYTTPEVEVSTKPVQNNDGNKIVTFEISDVNNLSYHATYALYKSDSGYIKLLYYVDDSRYVPDAELTIKKIEALA